MPIDINELRDWKGGNSNKWKDHMEKRFKDPTIVDQVLEHDAKWWNINEEMNELLRACGKLQKEIDLKIKTEETCIADVERMKPMEAEIQARKEELCRIADRRDQLLNRIGNAVDEEVPVSQDNESDSLVVTLHPLPTEAKENPNLLPCPIRLLKYTLPETKPLTHDVLLWRIGGYEPTRGRNVAGKRAYFLTNAGVLLNQAMINYSIAFLSKRGYSLLQPPYFMNKDVMSLIAQLEDFDEQLYKVSGKTNDTKEDGSDEKYLIATSEQPICAYHKDECIDKEILPLRYAGISACFRKEASNSGIENNGVLRVHQFDKVEQFCLTEDDLETSEQEQQKMVKASSDFYDSLGISYRVMCLVSGELNDAAVKKYDLEAWFPGLNRYWELVSCSNCTDFQARAVGVHCGIEEVSKDSTKRISYCHMLNSTLCATGRSISCLLETHQTAEGVVVPEVLHPFMSGKKFLPFVRGPPEVTIAKKKGKQVFRDNS